MVLESFNHWFQWFSMVTGHWSNNAMVLIYRSPLALKASFSGSKQVLVDPSIQTTISISLTAPRPMTPTPDSLTDLGGHQNMPRPCRPFHFFDEVFSQHKPHFEFLLFIDARTCSKSNRKQKMNIKSNVVSMHCIVLMRCSDLFN